MGSSTDIMRTRHSLHPTVDLTLVATRSLRRAAFAATHPGAAWIVIATLLGTFFAGLAGAVIVAPLVASWGAAVFATFVLVHTVSPTRHAALFGPVGPPLEPTVCPRSIHSMEIRQAYSAVLAAHESLRTTLGNALDAAALTAGAYARASDLVLLAGHVAATSNELHRYVKAHDPTALEISRLARQARSERATDDIARRAYARAAQTRTQQCIHHHELAGLHERIHARIELIEASLLSMEAVVVMMQARLLEEAVLGESLGELDILESEMMGLEGALQEALFPLGT